MMYAPQTPRPPYPYQQRHVRFESQADHASLDGTIFVPPGKGPFPGVVLLSGSGWDNRDYKRGGHRWFLVVADHLARRGVASLRFDDRSGFDSAFDNASLADLAGDAAAALHTLRAQTPIDPARTGFLGHSEGGLVAGVAATSVAEAANFFVLLGSPIVTGPQLVRWQTKAKGGTAGLAEVAVAVAQFREAVAEAKARGVSESQIERMEQQAKAKIMAIADASPEERAAGASKLWEYSVGFHAGGMRPGAATTNYEKAFAEIYAPVLALWGSQDDRVPPELSRDALHKALRHLPDHYRSLEILTGLNHSLRTAGVEDADDPRRFETIAPVALERISSWIQETVVRAGKEHPN